MPALQKASLEEMPPDPDGQPVPGTKIDVQFNPSSLKLQLANRVVGGDTDGGPKRQYLAKTSTTLTFDLYFDSADEGTTDNPVSVRTKTSALERFVLPRENGSKPPPKARFQWGELILDGIIQTVSIDFEHFAANGTPLRAKIGVVISEQDAKYALKPNTSPQLPGSSGVGPGSIGIGIGLSTNTGFALGGESAADFAVRAGLDPGAWRGFAGQFDSTLSLSAGLKVDFNAGLSVGGGIGISAGLEVGASASLEASFGLEVSAQVSAGATAEADLSAGFALSAAGGVGAALETVKIAHAETAAAATRQSFGTSVAPALAASAPAGTPSRGTVTVGRRNAAAIPGSSIALQTVSSTRPGLPDQPRQPLATHGMPSPSTQAAASPAPPPPLADARAISFGLGVPLRPRVGSAADLRAAEIAGRISLRPRSRPSDMLAPADPTAAPWTHLPADVARAAADQAQRVRRPLQRCGCPRACNHRRGG